MQELTHGTLPSYEAFSEAFDKRCLGGVFRIRGMERLNAIVPNGDIDFDKEMLWDWLSQCAKDWRSNHDLEDFAVEVLGTFGFKWVSQ